MKKNEILFKLLILIAIVTLNTSLYAQEEGIDELLELSLEELLDVKVITATKKSQKLSEVPATVRVITAEQIKERGYITLEDALADLPGFQFRDIVGFNSYVFMRGAPSQNNAILLMVDGILINELNSGGFYGGSHFNLSNAKVIEVVYGPASALYGTNAISGIINIITNDPSDIQGGHVSILAGNFDTRNVDFKIGRHDKEKDIGFSISGMFKQSDKADLRGEKGDNNWTDEMENFEDDLSVDGKFKYKNFRLGVLFQDKQVSRSTNYKSTGTNYLDHGTNWHIQFVNGYLKYLYEKSSRWSMQSLLYYRNATVKDNTVAFIKSDSGPTGGQAGYYRPNHLIGFENQFNLTVTDKLSIVSGIVLEQEKLSESFSKTYSGSPDLPPPAPGKPDMLTNHLASIYLQAQYKLIEDFEMTLGLRHDNSSYYGEVNTPRFGLVYHKNKLTSKFLFMQAFRAPRPWDYTWGDGNPDLQPEKMRSLELSAIYAFNDYLIANMSYYHNSIKGKFTKEGNRWINGDRLNTDGFEASLEYARGKFKSYFNYTYNSSVWDYGEKIPEIGKNNANVGVLYGFTNNLKLSVRGNYLGKRKNDKTIPSTGSDYVEEAFVLNSTLSLLNYNNLDFHLIANNLLNSEYYHTSNRPPVRYRQPQRHLLFKAAYNF